MWHEAYWVWWFFSVKKKPVRAPLKLSWKNTRYMSPSLVSTLANSNYSDLLVIDI